jgi:hypothetical protein
MAIGALAMTLSGGCSTMEDTWDDAVRRRDRDRDRVELNTAGRRRLAGLPGITEDDADRIVANRPYEKRRDLVRKRVLSEDEFERIRDRVYVERDGEDDD